MPSRGKFSIHVRRTCKVTSTRRCKHLAPRRQGLRRAGTLYVADVYNDRVLVYFAPFSADKAGGKGDTTPDLVIGQPDYTTNGPNRGRGPSKPGANTLHISVGGADHVASRGVSVDGKGNVWVADTFNYRVLRFPKGKTQADLVLATAL